MEAKQFEFGQWIRYESDSLKSSLEAQFIHYLAEPGMCTIDVKGNWLNVPTSRIKALGE